MKENKTLEELYKIAARHEFGDITLLVENQGGKLRGRFIFHPTEADKSNLETTLTQKSLPNCFGKPPTLIESDIQSNIIWDEHYHTLGDVEPIIEQEILHFSKMMGILGERLAQCATCPVFDRCYTIADLHLKRKQSGGKIEGKWTT